MKCRSVPYEKLPYSKLLIDYVRQEKNLSPFYSGHSFSEDSVRQKAADFRFTGDRNRSYEALEQFNIKLDAPAETRRRLKQLKDPNSLALVTGQQVTLYGGPLYTVYKTVTTLNYASRWEKLLGRPVIPVFWMADEDHDLEEVCQVGIFSDDNYLKLSCQELKANGPTGRVVLADRFKNFSDHLLSQLPESDFTSELRERIDKHYREGRTLREAFGRWMLDLFGSSGLIMAGSDDPAIKRLSSDLLALAANRSDELHKSLEEQSSRLEKSGFTRQAMVQRSNLFYLDKEGKRVKISMDGDAWSAGNGQNWDWNELIDEINSYPERFSPNVFLRPMLQDRLLPTIGYVAGPGELAYYGQMRSAYNAMAMEMPLLLPRFSITLMEPAIQRISEKLPFRFEEYAGRTEDLESQFVDRKEEEDIDAIIQSWKERTENLTDQFSPRVAEIDPTLRASADKINAVVSGELDKLRSKIYRSIKKREQIQIRRIHRVKRHLFPDSGLQERQISMIHYMNKYGLDVWDRLQELLQDQQPDAHKVVEL